MKNMEIIKIRLNEIINCIKEYSSEPSISTIYNYLLNALDENDFEVILFCCKEIEIWYQKNINNILSNEFVYNKEAHENNILLIREVIDNLEKNYEFYQQKFIVKNDTKNLIISANEIIENIVNKFHQVVIQLKDRYNKRNTLDVKDEYDVQDLLHALLRLYFDDIRPEEWTPSYAGNSSRQDFLLKSEKIVIETKKTRNGLDNKELANELIIDIARYKAHPDCKKLICFVYDPENRIKNPRGFENDLKEKADNLNVIIYIRP